MEILQFWSLLLLPPLLFAVWVHLLERFIQQRMSTAFGWRSVLVTGWFGTPVHELSHVAACLLFRHRIDEVQLFEPDPVEGRLGFVRHSYRRGNWFEEVGNVFIGTAPLAGGAAVLLALLLLFYPALTTGLFQAARTGLDSEGVGHLPRLVLDAIAALVQPASLATPRFWIFAFLTTCVAAHMAPSRSDYAGAMRGVLWLVLLAGLLTAVLFGVLPVEGSQIVTRLAGWLAPLFVVTSLAAGLVTLAAVVIWLFTAIMPAARRA